ncbi:MAG: ATP-grasp domain-containing protein [Oscillospiraceae bacterium]|nr:ATP-grasp domain-containing protein [Oscillospiraceae bacterium]
MKKILILGGSRYALPVIKTAHEMGVYVITADYLPDNIAHKYSDEYCNVSIVDQDATLQAAQERCVDGVISFACDPGVLTAAYVAEKIGLPSVGSYEAVSILQNKSRFRAFLAEHGFNVPTAKGYTSIESALRDASIFCWPVIVKPTDSAGSKGVSRVDDPAELRAAIEYALSYSRGKEFIVEDFITQKGFSSDSDCFSVDGELKFVSFNAQRFDPKAENPYTPAAYSWPSTMTESHQRELASEIQRLIRLLGLSTSVYNIESREGTDGKAYIMECSPRGGGNRLSECLEYATGVRLVENAVRAALGMPIVGVEQKPYNGFWAEVVLHSDRPGVFDSLWIDESIADAVYERDLWIEPGTIVGGFRAANEALGTLVFKFDTEARLKEVMDHIPAYVKVIVK